jgi:hypothetical protein
MLAPNADAQLASHGAIHRRSTEPRDLVRADLMVDVALLEWQYRRMPTKRLAAIGRRFVE